MAFRSRQPVRHPDVDRAGIVYFPRFYDIFHRALEDFFDQEVKLSYWDLEERVSVAQVAGKIRRLERGEPVSGIVDRALGY